MKKGKLGIWNFIHLFIALILTMFVLLIILTGCEYGSIDNAVYDEALNICHSKNVDQAKYCQCYASCEVQENRDMDFPPQGQDCHSLCREDWRDKNG